MLRRTGGTLMGVTSKVVVKDKGYKKLLVTMAQLARPARVRVGVFGDKAAAAHKNPHGDTVETITVGQIADWLENGTDNAPPREWLSGYVAANQERIKEMIRRVSQQIVKRGMTSDRALTLLGIQIKGEIQKRIASGELLPNAPSTIRAKGSSVAGIDSGQFRASIAYEVIGTKEAVDRAAGRAGKSARRDLKRAVKSVRRGSKRAAKDVKRSAKKSIRGIRKVFK